MTVPNINFAGVQTILEIRKISTCKFTPIRYFLLSPIFRLLNLGFFQFNFWVYSKQAYNQRIFDLVIFSQLCSSSSRDSTTNYDFPILSNSILDNDRIPFVQNNTNFNQLYHINRKSKRNIQPTRVMLINLFISNKTINHKILVFRRALRKRNKKDKKNLKRKGCKKKK